MLKLTVAVLAVALAGTAGAAGWRSMRLDASDLDSFTKSVAAFEEKLSTPRRYVFMLALQDLWDQGAKRAGAEQREYTDAEYFRQLDGLGYDEIVTLADPIGEVTRARYREGLMGLVASNRGELPAEPTRTRAGVSGQHPAKSLGSSATPVGGAGGQYRGGRGY